MTERKFPRTNSGTYWLKIYTNVSTTCKQNQQTRGAQWGVRGVTGAVVGGDLPENGGGFPLQSGAR